MVKKLAAPTLCVVLMALTAVSFVASLTFGSVDYNNAQVWEVVQAHLQSGRGPNQAVDSIVWELRAPRGVLALIVGAGLSLAGVAMQTLVRNPLADPYLLGVSSGASVGATAVLTFGLFSSLGLYALSGGALIGALVATATAVVGPVSFPDARAAQGVMFWMLGSVAGGQWNKLLLPAVVVAIALVVLVALSRPMDALAAGPDTAAALGVRVGLLRQVLFFIQALLVGAMVAIAGGIGFVGLVIPHLARMMVGSLHLRLLPIAAVLGALFVLWVDVIARISAPPQEIPLGVVTGVLGAPLFLLLMGRNRYRFGGQD